MGQLILPVHAVLGGLSVLRNTGTPLHPWVFHLPDGTISGTNFLSGGQSSRQGWPVRCEAAGRGKFLLLNLGHADLSLDALTNELDIRYQHGFPHLARVCEDLAATCQNFHGFSLKKGICFAVAEPDEDPLPLIPKLKAQAQRIGFSLQELDAAECENPHFPMELAARISDT